MNGIDKVKTKNKEPTNKQLNFMFALLSEPTISEACKKAHISEKTAYTWLKDTNFQMHYKKLRLDFLKNTTAKLQANTLRAVDTLINIMENEDLSASARVQCIRTLLEYSYKGTVIEDIQERLDKLEKQENKEDDLTIDLL
jgi:hypothetical protein